MRNKRFELYRATLKGDWDRFQGIDMKHEINMTAKLSKEGDTALHIAAAARRTGFVKKLLEHMNKEDLSIKNNAGNTAFFLAVSSGEVDIVKALKEKNEDLVKNREKDVMEKNEDVLKNRGDNYILPLLQAAVMGNKEMVEYLYEATGDELLDDNDRFKLVVDLIPHGLYDVALDLVERHPQIAHIHGEHGEIVLHHLARLHVPRLTVDLSLSRLCGKSTIYLYNEVKRKVINSVLGKKNEPMSFRDRLNDREQQRRNKMCCTDRTKKAKWKVNFRGEEILDSAFELVECLWKEVMRLDDSQILKIIRKPWSLIFEAAKQGNLRFLNIIFHEYPDLMFEVDKNNYTIFHYAFMYRHYNIFKIIYTIGPLKNLVVKKTDKKGNNILHLAAKLPEQDTPGAESTATLFKMSIEMRWFEVNIN
ncbi:hypothetical protein Pint_12327 [Pistacia integerrima]|uniref:Uncharacterized protein n=1 Tax=Pistacia integerrima TaxID=434235 RepID=A0ACC0XDX1_9ROSI|nr:hypothetical protein Pint_12327 [Pistacia integerrima]